MSAPTKRQANPKHHGTCSFGRQHVMVMPVFREGRQVSPVAGEGGDDWAECLACGRVEGSDGVPVLAPPFERCAR